MLRGRLAWLALAVASFGGTQACSSDGAAQSAAPIAQADFASRLADAICEGIAGCCNAASLPYDATTCRQTVLDRAAFRFGKPSQAYDPDQGGECVRAASAAARACDFDDVALVACARAIHGTLAEGSPCATGFECALPEGAVAASCDGGSCVVHRRGKAGDACGFTATQTGSRIETTSSGARGSSVCFTNDGLVCGPTGTCEPPGAIGATCEVRTCAAEAWCSQSAQFHCAARVAVGQPCSMGSMDSTCVVGAYCSGGTCAPRKVDGSPCSGTASDECVGYCSDRTCVQRGAVTKYSCAGTLYLP